MFCGLTRGMYTFLPCVFKNGNHAVKALLIVPFLTR